MIKQDLKKLLSAVCTTEDILIDYVPRDKEGDYSTNIALQQASQKKVSPLELARDIASRINDPMISRVSVHEPGFINFTLSKEYLLRKLFEEKEHTLQEKGRKILVEFVSANPTGPLNIVSARAAAAGDALVRLLNTIGYNASSEYYVNDTGRQTALLAESIKQRMIELNGGKACIPADGYHGTYLIDIARHAQDKGIQDIPELCEYATDYFINDHKETLEKFGVRFDTWFQESLLHKQGSVEKILHKFEQQGLVYPKDGAIWLKTSTFGDKDDRVIITSDKRYTYLLPDIAYHLHKIERGHNLLINIWGPDHQAQIRSLQSGLSAIGQRADILKVIIVQQVNLKKGGNIVKMSKRAGVLETLDDLLRQVPKDVVRFFMLMRSNSQHLDFDLDLALTTSEENPVFYVQYAHARIMSILRKGTESGVSATDRINPDCVTDGEDLDLLKTILKFPDICEDAARNYEPFMITYYLIEVARTFHTFYQQVRVLGEQKEVTCSRLALITKAAEIIKKGLSILGVSCPEKM